MSLRHFLFPYSFFRFQNADRGFADKENDLFEKSAHWLLALCVPLVYKSESERPDFWELFWERYVQSKLDYRAGQELLKNKHHQAGEDCRRLLQWLEPMAPERSHFAKND